MNLSVANSNQGRSDSLKGNSYHSGQYERLYPGQYKGGTGARRVASFSADSAAESSSQTVLPRTIDRDNINTQSLSTRNIKGLNRVLACVVGTGGAAIAGGVSLLDPVNLAMATMQHASGIASSFFPDNSPVQAVAGYAQNATQVLGLISTGVATVSSGSIIPIGLYGLRYICHRGAHHQTKDLCQYLPGTVKDYAEPWAQVISQCGIALACKTIENRLIITDDGSLNHSGIPTKKPQTLHQASNHTANSLAHGLYRNDCQNAHSPAIAAASGCSLVKNMMSSPEAFNRSIELAESAVAGISADNQCQLIRMARGLDGYIKQTSRVIDQVIPTGGTEKNNKGFAFLDEGHNAQKSDDIRVRRYADVPTSKYDTYPWIVEICNYRTNKEGKTVKQCCSGFMADKSTALTAAHCFMDQQLDKLNSTVELKNLAVPKKYWTIPQQKTWDEGEDTKWGKNGPLYFFYKVKEFYTHPDFNNQTVAPNDIAIARITDPQGWLNENHINFPYILGSPVTRENAGEMPQCLTAGYSDKAKLKVAKGYWVLDNRFIDKEIAGLDPYESLWNRGYLVTKPVSEKGDSGGPVFIHHNGNNYIQGINIGFHYANAENKSINGPEYIRLPDSDENIWLTHGTVSVHSPVASPQNLPFIKRYVDESRFVDHIPESGTKASATSETGLRTEASASNYIFIYIVH